MTLCLFSKPLNEGENNAESFLKHAKKKGDNSSLKKVVNAFFRSENFHFWHLKSLQSIPMLTESSPLHP